MKKTLSTTEQEDLKTRGIISKDEIAYRENNFIFAEDVLSGEKRVVNAFQMVKENKNILLG